MPNQNYEEFEAEVKKEFPEFLVRKKSDSTKMKILSWFLFVITFGRTKRETFMDSYITVSNYTMYVMDSWFDSNRLDWGKISILSHEREHFRQRREYGAIRFALAYALWPFPIGFANFRLKMEVKANAVQIVRDHRHFNRPLFGESFENKVRVLSGPDYFWPTFDSGKVKSLLRRAIMREIIVS